MPDQPPLSTRVIGETESALGALLAPLLAEAGLDFLQWVILSVVSAVSEPAAPAGLARSDGQGSPAGPGITRDQLAAQVTSARKVAAAEVTAALDALVAGGALAAGDGGLALTGAGRAIRDQVRGRLAEITSCLFDFPAADLAVAGRVLTTITARANAVLAGRGAGEAFR
jgi:hypothetical protein